MSKSVQQIVSLSENEFITISKDNIFRLWVKNKIKMEIELKYFGESDFSCGGAYLNDHIFIFSKLGLVYMAQRPFHKFTKF